MCLKVVHTPAGARWSNPTSCDDISGGAKLKPLIFLLLVSMLPTQVHAQTLAQQQLPKGTVDGAKHPELIPDDIAWQTFIVFTSHLEESSPGLRNAQLRDLAAQGVSPSDLTTLVSILSEFHANHKPLLARLLDPATTDSDRTTQITQRKELITGARRAIEQSLTPEGVALLRAYVQKMKAGIRLYPIPAAQHP
jgi:hypothetical protein